MDLVNKEGVTENPLEETINAPEFTLTNETPVQEQRLAPKIRYQYF